MDITDIATRDFVPAAPDDRIGALRSSLEKPDTAGVLVVDDEEPAGVVTPRELLRSQVDDDTRVETLRSRVPAVDRDAGVRAVARLFVENRTYVVPVVEDGQLWGSVAAADLLSAVRDYLSVLAVEEIHAPEVEAVTEETTMGEVVNTFRERDVPRLPVVEPDGRLTGVVTRRDVVEFVVRDPEEPSPGSGARGATRRRCSTSRSGT